MNKKDVAEVMQDMIDNYQRHIENFNAENPYVRRLREKKECYEICLALVQAIEEPQKCSE
jgi:hypothetical protein